MPILWHHEIVRTLLISMVLGLAACSKGAKAPAEPSKPQAATPAASGGAALVAPLLRLQVTVDGAPSTWPSEKVTQVPHFASHGEDSHDCWSLRELARLWGPQARVSAVIGDSKETIALADWQDPKKIPAIHTNRRGAIKFRWADTGGQLGDTVVKDVAGLELVTSGR
jgi:hypothetical protein